MRRYLGNEHQHVLGLPRAFGRHGMAKCVDSHVVLSSRRFPHSGMPVISNTEHRSEERQVTDLLWKEAKNMPRS